MGKTIAIVILAILAIALLVVVFQQRGQNASWKEQLASSQAQLASCQEQLKAPCVERIKEYKVVPDCHLEDGKGCTLTGIHVSPSSLIRWINTTEEQVGIEFPPGSMEGGDSITIPAGESKITTTTATGFADSTIIISYVCGDKEGPPVNPVNCPPPPAPCP